MILVRAWKSMVQNFSSATAFISPNNLNPVFHKELTAYSKKLFDRFKKYPRFLYQTEESKLLKSNVGSPKSSLIKAI